ncbi:DUF3833 domain-containing protein [Pseudoalteromonas sp. SSDWG2]|uniref:DUF3833 domain-containing protein n=1 Tax=Pseudoalteromonas sp. SSDWG2 TaxID=3139391 RepID=UPI003BAC70F3
MKKFLLGALVYLLVGCSASIDDYEGSEPNFDFKRFFNGDLVAYGVVQDYTGMVTRRFKVDMQASWQGDNGIIDEQFYYQDGETDERVWKIALGEDGTLTGTANDVIGVAKGETKGGAFHWQYTLAIPHDGDTLEVNLDDWMFLVTETRLINRTTIDKLGIEVGEITLVIEKVEK